MKRFLLAIAAVVAAGVAASSAMAATVGSTAGACTGYLSPNAYSIAVSPASYTIPASGKVTKWSFVAYDALPAPTVQLKVFRPLGGGQYLVVGQSAAVTAAGGTFSTSIAVHAGDIIGIENLPGSSGAPCEEDGTGTIADAFGNPQPGDTVTPSSQTFRPLLSATLTPGNGSKTAPIPQVDHVFLCYSKFQTDPGVWESDTGALLLKAGYWLPYALPGNMDGATNLGDYHLACNLTGTQKPTGGFVDDGGGTWSADYAAMTGLYPQAG
jgi:hypothetical protein